MASRETESCKLDWSLDEEIEAMDVDNPELPLDKEKVDNLKVIPGFGYILDETDSSTVEVTDELAADHEELLDPGEKIGLFENLEQTYQYGDRQEMLAQRLEQLENQITQGVTAPTLWGTRVDPAEIEKWEAEEEEACKVGKGEIERKTLQRSETTIGLKEGGKIEIKHKKIKVTNRKKLLKRSKTIVDHYEARQMETTEFRQGIVLQRKETIIDLKEAVEMEEETKEAEKGHKRKEEFKETNENIDQDEFESEQPHNKGSAEVTATPSSVTCHLEQPQQETTENNEQHASTSPPSCETNQTETNGTPSRPVDGDRHHFVIFDITTFIVLAIAMDLLVDYIFDKYLGPY